MIALLALALAAGQPHCSLQRPALCGGMYELAETPGFARAVRRFVGGGRATWYEPHADRARQLLDIYRGVSSNWAAAGPDLLRFDACYPHICTIRAALFITRAGDMRGAALVYAGCAGRACSGDEGLNVTILRDRRYSEVAELARQWAERDVAEGNERFPFLHEVIARVDVEDVPSTAGVPARRVSRLRRRTAG
jgi:hypothetical protein